jgi:hypothetical protein
MGVVLFLGFVLGFLGVVIFGVVAIVNRGDLSKRRRWNAWVLGSLAVALVCIAPFLIGVKVS